MFYFPVTIIAGEGCRRQLGTHLRRLERRRPLIVTDPGIASAGHLAAVAGLLKKEGMAFETFQEVAADPPMGIARRAARALQAGRHDLVVALGGGSAIDVAKAAAILAVNDIDLLQYQGPRQTYPRPPLPLMTLPTTAGSGSEVSSAALLVDEQTRQKVYLKSPQLFPRIAFLDGALVAGIPASIAAVAGADVLCHAVESLTNPHCTFVARLTAVRSIQLIFVHLRSFVADTRSRTRGQQLLEASALAGMAMTTAGLGLVHAIAHPLGVRGRISHGMACGLLLPAVMRFNCAAVSSQYSSLIRTVGGHARFEKDPPRNAAAQVIRAVEKLLGDIGLPANLPESRSIGNAVAAIAAEAHASFLNHVNPRPASRAEIEGILKQIL